MVKFKEVVKTTNTKNPKSTNTSIFHKFKEREEKEEVKNPIVKKNENVEKLKEVFKGHLDWYETYRMKKVTGISIEYSKALELIKEKGINCTSKDIEEFSLELVAFEDHKEFKIGAGLFLSALINTSEDEEFIIHTRHLKKKINFLGYDTTKNIVIERDAGDWLGEWMKKGSSITVNGDAGRWVGHGMYEGSKIYFNGNYRSINNDIRHGSKIYHKGKLVK
jgi:hypothetical protein